MKKLLKTPLWAQILAGIIIGIIIGIVSPKAADFISPLGDIFLNLLKMLIVPLVLFSITNGICSMKDAKQLRSVGGRIVIYYTLSTVAASIFGVIGGMITQPGKNVSDFVLSGEAAEASDFDMVENIISWFPDNIVKAMVDANMIQIIVFCLFLGVALLALGDQASTFVKIIKEGNDIMLKITSYVIGFSPIAILSLIASMVSTLSGAMVKEVIVFILTIDITILVFMVVFYPTVLKLLARVNVRKFFKKISTSMLVAFTTTSSAATLPVSIKMAEERLGCSEKVYGFTLPLGNTCNMDGAAIQYSVIAIFACNLFGLDITPERIFQFIFLSLILSIGAAGVKGSGIVMSTIIIQTIIGDAGLTLIPILAAVWPILDPFATMANNVGDLTGTTLVSKSLKMLDEDVYNS